MRLMLVISLVLGCRSWESVESGQDSGSKTFTVMSMNDFNIDVDEMISDIFKRDGGQSESKIHALLGFEMDAAKGELPRYKRLSHKIAYDLDYGTDSQKKIIGNLVVKKRNERPKRGDVENSAYTDGNSGHTNDSSVVTTSEKTEYPEDYDFTALKDEYYQTLKAESNINNTFLPEPEPSTGKLTKLVPKIRHYTLCKSDSWKRGVGLWALACILREAFRTGFSGPVLIRLLVVIKFWVLTYIVIGSLVWAWSGYCCCCLFCSIFKPDQIHKEVKEFIVNNPPGRMRGQPDYEPTEKEKAAYRELELKVFSFV